MPIEPVKIPQNIYVEDRIIGPVTLRQIMIILAGSGLSYAFWSATKAAGAASPIQIISWAPCVIAVAFAFVKINGISLLRISFLFLERIEKPNIRKWSPREGISINISTGSKKKKKTKIEEPEEKEKNGKDIKKLSALLDRGPEENEAPHMQKVEPSPVETQKKRPVDPEHVTVEHMEEASSIDGLTVKTPETTDQPANALLRDIHPPK